MANFAQRLRELRTDRKLTQKRLGEILEVNSTTITKWEQGKFEPPTEMIKKIAVYFDVSTDYLLGQTDEISPVDDLKAQINSSTPDLNKIVKHTKPHINGVPLTEEQTDMLIDFLETVYKRIAKEKGLDPDPYKD
jgi:transcriptional regulator with XRE-family HTH domain